MILHIQTSILHSSEGIWISQLMRELPFPSWEQTNHQSLRHKGETKWNPTQPWMQQNPCGHLWLHDVLSMSPVTSKLPVLWRQDEAPHPSSPPSDWSNFSPLTTTVTELLLLAVWKLSFPVEQRLLQPIDKNFIHRQPLLCGARGGEMF